MTARSSQKEMTNRGEDSSSAEENHVETEAFDFSGLLEAMPSWLVSTLIHVVLILFLAIFTLARAPEKNLTLIVAPNDYAEVFTELEVVEYEDVEFEEDASMEEMVYSENDLSLPAVNSTVANTCLLYTSDAADE